MAPLTQFLDRFARDAAFQHQHARPGGARPEGGGEMLAVPGRRVDRLLQVHAAMDVAQEHLRDPLLLLVAARRAPAHVRLAVAMREGRRQRGTRPLARRQRAGLAFLEPADLAARAHAGSRARGRPASLQPAARRRRRNHVAVLVDDVEMHGVAAASGPMRPTVGSPAPLAATAAREPSRLAQLHHAADSRRPCPAAGRARPWPDRSACAGRHCRRPTTGSASARRRTSGSP